MQLKLCKLVSVKKLATRANILRYSTVPNIHKYEGEIEILGEKYATDKWTNVTPKIISHIGKNLHVQAHHPLSHVRKQIVDYFYKNYRNRVGNPSFSVFDNLSPVVNTAQNFDMLLVAPDHPCRNKSDCYYINHKTLLRAHTTAHQNQLISMGLNNFLVIGDVYRRDEIDSTHYPVFHQVDAVRTCTAEEVFKNVDDSEGLKLFEHLGVDSADKQGCHTMESVKLMEHELKTGLVGLAQALFGSDVQYRWVDQYFPFTHPSWELEIFYNNAWLEILGCGIMRQEILQKAGATDRIGWAFGLGLERLAMRLYQIPDIRLFWSTDTGFLSQFITNDPYTPIIYKPVSIYPPCSNDISFWLPSEQSFCSNDFYDLVREVGSDTVEQIQLIDEFVHPKTKKTSHCYRIIYRHMERTLTQKEVSALHTKIMELAPEQLGVTLRK